MKKAIVNHNSTNIPSDELLLFALNKKILKLLGLWPHDFEGNSWKRVFYLCYCWGLLAYSISFAVMLSIQVVSDAYTSLEITKNFSVMILMLIIYCKWLTVIYMGREFKDVTTFLQLKLSAITNKDGETGKILRDARRRVRQITLFHIGLYYITNIIWNIDTIANISSANYFNSNNTRCAENDVTNCTFRPHMMMKAKYPFEVNNPFREKLVYLHQMLLAFINSTSNSAFNPFFVALMIYHTASFKILGKNLAGVEKNVSEMEKLPKTGSNKGEKKSNIQEYLSESVKHHQELLQSAKKMSDLLSLSLLIVFLVMSISICVACFQAVIFPPNSMEFANVISYSSLLFAELGLLCWYANELTIAAEMIGMRAYETTWYVNPLLFKRYVALIMERSKTPVVLAAGKFGKYSVETFIAVLRTSYSFFTLLRQVLQK